MTQNVNGVPHVVLINPESNEDLLDSFDHEAIHAADLLFEASNPELAAKADAVMDRESPEFDQELYHFLSQEYNGWSNSRCGKRPKKPAARLWKAAGRAAPARGPWVSANTGGVPGIPAKLITGK